MKAFRLVLAAGAACVAWGAQAQNDDQSRFCSSSASQYASWVESSRASLSRHAGALEQLQLRGASQQNYQTAAERLRARANTLLTTNLSHSEVRADLYGLCMAVGR